MPVTTRIITAERGSTRSVKLAVKSPEAIQVNTWFAIARDSGSSPTSRTTAASETANDASSAPHATAPDAALLRRRPTLAFTRKPRNGRRGMSKSMSADKDTEDDKGHKGSVAPGALRVLCQPLCPCHHFNTVHESGFNDSR